jgi:hypothetical protein
MHVEMRPTEQLEKEQYSRFENQITQCFWFNDCRPNKKGRRQSMRPLIVIVSIYEQSVPAATVVA